MNHIQMANVLPLLLLISIHSIVSAVSFKCTEAGKCIRRTDPPNNNTLFECQNACRLTCGRYGALWPKPTGSTIIKNGVVRLNPHNIRFEHQGTHGREYLDAINGIFLKNIASECEKKDCVVESDNEVIIEYSINVFDETLTWETDESYSLVISTLDKTTTVQISSHTLYGARHALETLSQLITVTNGPSTNFNNVLIIVSSAQIKDRPTYAHRGLLIDTARNFLPIADIERTLDGMGASKLNVFHWHATDTQSFPLEIVRVPQMTVFGAYSPDEIYTLSDVRHIVKYAKHRGIRVIMEIDAPSHAGNGWQWGPSHNLGNLSLCVNEQPWRSFCIQPPCGQLNPINSNVYEILRSIYIDLITSLASEETIHMGGDEVHFGCWNASTEIVDYLYNNGMGRTTDDFMKLWGDFQAASLRVWDEEKHISFSNSSSKPVILWSSHLTDPEHIDSYLNNERYIIQTWVPQTDSLPKKLLSKGYKLIMSTKDAWYFDHGFWGQTRYYTWKMAYKNRIPRDRNVLGGEACVWSELIDRNSIDERTWPRAAAVAERLWSDPDTDATIAEQRFYRHRERLVDRGVRAEAVTPRYCVLNEGECT
ncbi:chitooligosaccharidolytic beta-N-acetylglucosaminidase [Bradysia coprophila]|uniref:chitooligosaccharidolytic beta-N-acetylglucosaminidase n=1 Tax=Bradysia coprophila TaxID=38358 RepID=UPI00187DDA19|nr:chitooligosaccharidolytic beta-N-acetylglucosaminidase [Bradysia coprophila]XP_037028824.1 chitooligosaccharidolytic beta-N-acetylglucosaminidase [Bradysia coprophila]